MASSHSARGTDMLICLDCGLEGIVGDANQITECPDCQGDVV